MGSSNRHNISRFSVILVLGAFFYCQGLFASSPGTTSPLDTVIYATGAHLENALREAEKMVLDYDFSSAIHIYEDILEGGVDEKRRPSIQKSLDGALWAETYQSACSTPICISRGRFPLQEAFLYYPLQEGGWHTLPSDFDSSTKGLPFPSGYFPSGEETIYFSSHDSLGISNLYVTRAQESIPAADSTLLSASTRRLALRRSRSRNAPPVSPGLREWSTPELLGQELTGPSNEIFPMLSADGQILYFASDGFDSMGGYDLFESHWDPKTESWGTPHNLGFPYSTPYNDYLAVETSDGRHLLFASDRGCPRDSVNIYVVIKEEEGNHLPIFDKETLAFLCDLNPVNDVTLIDNSSTMLERNFGLEGTDIFSELYTRARTLRLALDGEREWLDSLGDLSQTDSLRSRVFVSRNRLSVLADSLSVAMADLRSFETFFLSEGLSFNVGGAVEEADREVVGEVSGYTFSKKGLGGTLPLTFKESVPSSIFAFSNKDGGAFAKDNNIPMGLVYRIEMFTSRTLPDVSELGGLSPVTWEIIPGGRLVNYAGIFGTYQEALSHLNEVRMAGFPEADVVAWLNRESVSIAHAREAERGVHEIFRIRIFPSDEKSLSGMERIAVDSLGGHDLVRDVFEGRVSYLLGDYDTKEEATKDMASLEKLGLSSLQVESGGMSVPQ